MSVILIDPYRVVCDEREEVYRKCWFSQLMFGRVGEDGPCYQPRVSQEELDRALASTSLRPKQVALAKQIASEYAGFVFRSEVQRIADLRVLHER
ncbi:hypothetical protein ABIB00_002139 [Bradyrhizobium sp. LB14.3]|uniref:hypothetical protein n=1 Tax=Bradyrhizobium sp. LB14.3 TaxID=3156328 RepID=UPI003391ECE5